MDHERPHEHRPVAGERRSPLDDASDLGSQVRAAKLAAELELEAFGDPGEYRVEKIYGQRTNIAYELQDRRQEAPAAEAARLDPAKRDSLPRKDRRNQPVRQTSLAFRAAPGKAEEG